MAFELIEPLRELFKDEVREIGRELGLPERDRRAPAVSRPRLAVRIIGDGHATSASRSLREADAIVREEIDGAGLDRKPWQYFAVLRRCSSVGVMGDGRTYDRRGRRARGREPKTA